MMIAARNAFWTKKRLPYKRAVQYLQPQLMTAAEQYTTRIDTGVSPTSDTEVYIEFTFLNTNAGDQLCSARTGTTGESRFFVYASSGGGRSVMGAWERGNIGLVDSSVHTILFNESGTHNWYIDGTLMGTIDPSLYVKDNSRHLLLFATSGYEPSYGTSNSRIYTCRIKEAGVLVHDFLPVIDWHNVPCMYDAVTDTNFYNVGNGHFMTDEDVA